MDGSGVCIATPVDSLAVDISTSQELEKSLGSLVKQDQEVEDFKNSFRSALLRCARDRREQQAKDWPKASKQRQDSWRPNESEETIAFRSMDYSGNGRLSFHQFEDGILRLCTNPQDITGEKTVKEIFHMLA